MKPSLVVVGIGIKALEHITLEVRFEIERAEIIFSIVTDPLTTLWLNQLNSNHVVLNKHYSELKSRNETYNDMVQEVIEALYKYQKVCFVSYGHPGVFAFPTHESIKRAQKEGFHTKMLPGISSEDCLFCDLGIDPGNSGCQSFEATDFLLYKRKFDVNCTLILWQIGVIGVVNYKNSTKIWNKDGIKTLSKYLLEFYHPDHVVTIYEAATFGIAEPKIIKSSLLSLSTCDISAISTLYVPPIGLSKPDNNMLQALNLDFIEDEILNI